jgi:malonyl CoA-acyl carrier protein transacylase
MSNNSANNDYRSLMQNALIKLEEMQSKLNVLERAKTEPIAIIGIGCRFPGGADNPDSFWELLRNGVDTITEVPANRWDIDAYYDSDPNAPRKMYTRYGSFLEQVDKFDPQFFGIAPREAVFMDPQQRLLLEVTWEALENAKLPPVQLLGSKTGVFVGVMNQDYFLLSTSTSQALDMYTGTGNSVSFAAGRLSYIFGFEGPSLAVDTACSSSLLTVHLACQSLRMRECNLAVAGGANVILSPISTILECRAQMLSPDGRCKTFDAAADGFVRGEGCGMIVLKRLSDALADKDNILALIRGSAVNQDGRSSGMTVPRGPAQEELIRQALANAGIDEPAQVSYIEAHGTGTSLGDPIEVKALGAVFGKNRLQNKPLVIGSVKTNLGHLEGAAGIAGLIKVVLSLQNKEIPPNLHFKEPNPYIAWEKLPVIVPTQRFPWLAEGERGRIAGVSSFGFSGTNAHVVLEEAPRLESVQAEANSKMLMERPLHMLTLSAKTQEALKELALRYQNHLAKNANLDIKDICFSVTTGRSHFSHRLCVLTESSTQAQEKLAAFAAEQQLTGIFAGQAISQPKVVFLFTGQGSQYVGMGQELYNTQPTFRAAIDQCDEILHPYLHKPLLSVLYPNPEQSSPIDETAYTQSALFALEYALYQLWTSWGIQPNCVMGHSVGEYVAATVAGVFSLEDGLKLIAARGQLMQALPENGAMVAIMADVAQVQAAIASVKQQLAIAAINTPTNVVISGEREAVETVVSILAVQGIKTTPLKVSHAFHSPLMAPMLGEYEQLLEQVKYSRPRIDLISNVTGELATKEIATKEYWLKHILEPVQFAASIETLHQQGYEVFVECGPKPVLLGMARQCLPEEVGVWLPSLGFGTSDWQQMLLSLGQLYVHGVPVDWSGFDRDYPRRRLPLPTYPWQRQRYWIETKARHQSHLTSAQDLLHSWLYQVHWQIQELSQPELVVQSGIEVNGRGLQSQEWERESKKATRKWLILADKQGIGRQLVTKLQAYGHKCSVVFPAQEYQQIEEEFYINPAAPDNWQKLLLAVHSQKTPLHGVVHLGSLDIEQAQTQVIRLDSKVAREHSYGSVLHLVQALLQIAEAQLPRLWLVTQGAVSVTKPSLTGLAQSPVWGMSKVIAKEHPELKCVRVDLDPEAMTKQVEALWAEIWSTSSKEDQVAFRGQNRYVARLKCFEPTSGAVDAGSLKFSQDGTYLITGGLGGLGLLVAGWMVEHGARQLVLVGRSQPSPEVNAQLQELQQAGAKVLVAQADVSQTEELARVLSEIEENVLPPLRGIIHAAAVLDDGIVLQQTWERLEKVMAPKVEGAWNLHTLTLHQPLDFFVLFSSIASLLGSPGQSNYAGANAFLDALAHYRQGQGLPGLSINWGAVAQVGAFAERQTSGQARMKGIGTIQPQKVLEVLELLLSQSAAQVGVVSIDWLEFEEKSGNQQFYANFTASLKQKITPSEQQNFPLQLQEIPVSKRREHLVSYICFQVAKVLGFNPSQPLDLQKSFFDLGMDSLVAVELRNCIQTDIGHFLYPTLVFDYPTVEALVNYLSQNVFSEILNESVVKSQQEIRKAATLENLEAKSQEELADLLAKKLKSLRRS